MILLYYSLYKEKPVMRLGYKNPLSCDFGQGYMCVVDTNSVLIESPYHSFILSDDTQSRVIVLDNYLKFKHTAIVLEIVSELYAVGYAKYLSTLNLSHAEEGIVPVSIVDVLVVQFAVDILKQLIKLVVPLSALALVLKLVEVLDGTYEFLECAVLDALSARQLGKDTHDKRTSCNVSSHIN